MKENFAHKLTVVSEYLGVQLLLVVLFNGINDTFEGLGVTHLCEQEIDEELVEISIKSDELFVIELVDLNGELIAKWVSIGVIRCK